MGCDNHYNEWPLPGQKSRVVKADSQPGCLDRNPGPLLTCCVSLDKSLNFLVPLFPHCSGTNNSINLTQCPEAEMC